MSSFCTEGCFWFSWRLSTHKFSGSACCLVAHLAFWHVHKPFYLNLIHIRVKDSRRREPLRTENQIYYRKKCPPLFFASTEILGRTVSQKGEVRPLSSLTNLRLNGLGAEMLLLLKLLTLSGRISIFKEHMNSPQTKLLFLCAS